MTDDEGSDNSQYERRELWRQRKKRTMENKQSNGDCIIDAISIFTAWLERKIN